jgi:hypothetical protein
MAGRHAAGRRSARCAKEEEMASTSVSGASAGASGGPGAVGRFDVGLNRSFSVGRQAVESFTPGEVSNLLLYLDAGSAVVSSGIVNSWTDLSGQGNHANQATPGQRAATGVPPQNGFLPVQNDGIDDNYGLASTITLFDWDIFAVGRVKDILTDSIVLSNDSLNRQAVRLDGTRDRLISYDGGQSVTSSVTPVPLTVHSVVEFARLGVAQVEFWQNGIPLGGSIDFGTSQPTMPVNALFQLSGTPQGTTQILALLVYSRRLNASERANVTAYLRARFAV